MSEDLVEKLHTLLQAGLLYVDSGMHAARRLVEQWRAYYVVRAQGPGQRLGGAMDSANRRATQTSPQESEDGGEAEGTAQQSSLRKQQERCVTVGTKKRKEADTDEKSQKPLPVKRLRKKTPAAVAMGYYEDKESEPVAADVTVAEEDFFVLRCDTSGSRDPRRSKERRVLALSKQVSNNPTLPWQWQGVGLEKKAHDLPACHCGLKECEFTAESEEDLHDHIVTSHAPLFAELCGVPLGKKEMLQMYAEAITWQCQSGAPVANVSIDRRALRGYQSIMAGNSIACLVCFVCARKYPYVAAGRNQEIGWVQPMNQKKETFFGQPLARGEEVLGLRVFKEKYVDKGTAVAQEEMAEELRSWTCEAHFPGKVIEVVCCPEDKECDRHCGPERLCPQCWVPLCRDCRRDLVWNGQHPAAALSNDMMVYYGPRNVYSNEVTVMEMLCASPCLTTMICFSLEQRLRGDRALDQDAWNNRQRMACRGNATTFPLAWEDLLQQLQDLQDRGEGRNGKTAPLPHCGRRLAEIVNVIVKSHQKQGTVDAGRILHQARVRRGIVVRLIEDAVARGHPAFAGVNMQATYTSAEALPEDGIPPEVIAELPYDNDLDRIMRQKAATPVRQEMAGEALAQELKHMTKPNAVVGERTSLGMADVNAQHVSALQATAARSQGQTAEQAEVVLQTGNKLLDQFRPEYFGFAFPYVFRFCTGMPDPPAWSQVPGGTNLASGRLKNTQSQNKHPGAFLVINKHPGRFLHQKNTQGCFSHQINMQGCFLDEINTPWVPRRVYLRQIYLRGIFLNQTKTFALRADNYFGTHCPTCNFLRMKRYHIKNWGVLSTY